jgi:hypothetical protein
MGALDYALAGAVKGGADTFLQVSGEERAENREIRKEARVNNFQEIRDRRLAEIQGKEKKLDRASQESEGLLDRQSRTANLQAGFDARSSDNAATIEARSSDNAATVAARSATDASRLEFDQSKPMTENTSDGTITKQYDPETKTWEVVTDNPKDDGTMGGWDIDAVDKEFDSKADTYFGSLDKSGVLSAFDSDEKASMAGRAASIASTTWRKYQGRIDPNTIWTHVFETIKGGKVRLDADLAALDAEIKAIPEEAWYKFDETNRANRAEKGKLEDERAVVESTERSDIDSLNMGGGMLNRATEAPATDASGVPTVTTKEQYDALKSGDTYIRDGVKRRKK